MDISNNSAKMEHSFSSNHKESVVGSVSSLNSSNNTIKKEIEHPNKKISQEEINKRLNEAVERLNSQADILNQSLKFSVDKESEVFQVSVIDIKTNEVIRKFPTEEAINLMMKMQELIGILFDERG